MMAGDCSGNRNRSRLLRDAVQGPRAPAPAPEQPQEGPQEAHAWTLEPHVCRGCFSRIVSRPAGYNRVYQCTNCGAEAVGASPDVLCSCGIKIRRPTKGAKSGQTLVDAGVRCAPNPDPRPGFESLFVALESGI